MASINDSTVDPTLLLDRFLSASAAQDVVASLEAILDAVQNDQIDPSELLQRPDDAESESFLSTLLPVLRTAQYQNRLTVQEGPSLAARLYQQLLVKTKDPKGTATVLLSQPPGLLETLIDVAAWSAAEHEADSSEVQDPSSYTRVVCIKVLYQTASLQPKLAQSQFLQAPNGLHRIGAVLLAHEDVAVRNEALILTLFLAGWSSVAKVLIFNQVGDVVMQVIEKEGGLEGASNGIVVDCLQVLQALLQHDVSMSDLVIGESTVVMPVLAQLLDCRRGSEFRDPTLLEERMKKKAASPPLARKKKVKDDLDDLLQTGDQIVEPVAKGEEPPAPLPRLTPAEESVMKMVLDLLSLLMESESVRKSIWTKHDTLASLIWELSLICPPQPGQSAQCAMPSVTLQQRALHTTGMYLYDWSLVQKHVALDRLLYLVCTGGIGCTTKDQLRISTAALHVIRRVLTGERAQELLMLTMAPPMENEGEQQQSSSSVVHKLLHTVFENVTCSLEELASRHVVLVGALGGLQLFFTDEPSRAMVLRLTAANSPTLVDAVWTVLQQSASSDSEYVPVVLLRFLCFWIKDAPDVCQAVLGSAHSSVLPTLVASTHSSVATLASVLLGLAMEYMNREEEDNYGGWTRDSIMDLIQTIGVSKFNQRLETFKTVTIGDDVSVNPWSASRLERDVWNDEYLAAVRTVRRRVIKESTQSSVGEHKEVEDPLKVLLKQQTAELETIRASLLAANETISKQGMYLCVVILPVIETPLIDLLVQ